MEQGVGRGQELAVAEGGEQGGGAVGGAEQEGRAGGAGGGEGDVEGAEAAGAEVEAEHQRVVGRVGRRGDDAVLLEQAEQAPGAVAGQLLAAAVAAEELEVGAFRGGGSLVVVRRGGPVEGGARVGAAGVRVARLANY